VDQPLKMNVVSVKVMVHHVIVLLTHKWWVAIQGKKKWDGH